MNTHDVLASWANRSGEYSPDYYAHYGPNEASERVRALLDEAIEPIDPVIELGCSSGRHLAHLHEAGYSDLHGIEINKAAFDVMAEEYPALADAGTFHATAIEDVVGEFDDDAYRAVFSVQTLQHVHPENAWVFDEIVRIAEDLIVTVEIEVGEDGDPMADDAVNYVNDEFPLYYRNWNREFIGRGCEELAAASVGNDTVRAFRPPAE